MAARLLIQKLSSGVYRSTGRLGSVVASVTRTASATRYFSTVHCSHGEAKTSWPVKRTFSSSSFNKHKASSEPKMSPRQSTMEERCADLKKTTDTAMALAVFSGLGWIYIAYKV